MEQQDWNPWKEAEKNFSENLKMYREQRGFNQADLAEAMRKAGYPWHNTTVYKVENGQRAIHLVEAIVLAELLDTTIEDLLEPTGIAVKRAFLEKIVSLFRGAWKSMLGSVDNQLQIIGDIKETLERFESNNADFPELLERMPEEQRSEIEKIKKYSVEELRQLFIDEIKNYPLDSVEKNKPEQG